MIGRGLRTNVHGYTVLDNKEICEEMKLAATGIKKKILSIQNIRLKCSYEFNMSDRKYGHICTCLVFSLSYLCVIFHLMLYEMSMHMPLKIANEHLFCTNHRFNRERSRNNNHNNGAEILLSSLFISVSFNAAILYYDVFQEEYNWRNNPTETNDRINRTREISFKLTI